MRTIVGLPRSLLFHRYHVLWTYFFDAIDVETVASPPSNRAILARGVELAVDETCIPVKIFLGHVDALRDKADYILVPRIVTLARGETACVKFLGAYDVARNSVPGVRLLEYNVDVANGVREGPELRRIGRMFGTSHLKARRAYRVAAREQARHAIELANAQERALGQPGLKVLLVGHPYNLYDALLGKPMIDFLRSKDVVVVCSEISDLKQARALARRVSEDIPWTFNKELLGALELYRDRVDGVVFLVTFPCGPDSLMTELCMRSMGDTPAVMVVLDELQSEAGLRTRLESFVDLMEARRSLRSGGGGRRWA